MECQICFDKPAATAALLAGICGNKNCQAQVCQNCLGRHVEVSLKNVYIGLLPKVRCPICLTFMNKHHWMDRLDNSQRTILGSEYDNLCNRACSLRTPCCHSISYTHLLQFKPDSNIYCEMSLVTPSKVATFNRLLRQFCNHSVQAREIVNFLFTHLGKERAIPVLEATMERMEDNERRATLLLSYMHADPNTYTRCCRAKFCFNCKRSGHHKRCDDQEELVEAACMVQCRRCRTMLVKVEGCDSVVCMCGYSMVWPNELQYRKWYKLGFVPVDFFDEAAFFKWLAVHQKLMNIVGHIKKQQTMIRAKKFYAWVEKYKPLLRRVISTAVWYRRFQRMLPEMEREFYWNSYRRHHPDHGKETEETIDAFFAMNP